MRILNSVISLSLLFSVPINTMQTKEITTHERKSFITAKEEIERIQMEREGRKTKCSPEVIKSITSISSSLIKGAAIILAIILGSVIK